MKPLEKETKINKLHGKHSKIWNLVTLPWVKVQNFQNPELLKLKS